MHEPRALQRRSARRFREVPLRDEIVFCVRIFDTTQFRRQIGFFFRHRSNDLMFQRIMTAKLDV